MLERQFIHPHIIWYKRLLDIIAASAGLLILIVLFPFIALTIKLNSQGPIFFRQIRIGRSWPNRTELFYMIKFRTMCSNAEQGSGPVWAAKNDSRITAVGQFLRKTRLDELPQFINVIRGEMSLIGPRPERPGIAHTLENNIPFFTERTYGVKPGITGLAQVNQGYDETLDDVRSKLAYDLSYSLSLTRPKYWLQMECQIMLKTVAVMILGRGQ